MVFSLLIACHNIGTHKFTHFHCCLFHEAHLSAPFKLMSSHWERCNSMSSRSVDKRKLFQTFDILRRLCVSIFIEISRQFFVFCVVNDPLLSLWVGWMRQYCVRPSPPIGNKESCSFAPKIVNQTTKHSNEGNSLSWILVNEFYDFKSRTETDETATNRSRKMQKINRRKGRKRQRTRAINYACWSRLIDGLFF